MEKISIIGSGNIGLSLARGLINKGEIPAENITLTRRNVHLLEQERALGFEISSQNASSAANADIVVISVLPQQLNGVLNELKPILEKTQPLIISVASGVTCRDIRTLLGESTRVVRAMPNTAISIGQSMTCIASDQASAEDIRRVSHIFENVGTVIEINEELMTSATALCACGIAFFLRAIRAASQGGVEVGFHAKDALKMAVQTAKGAADLLLYKESHPEDEIDKVTSPKGCTIAGLNEMEYHGFSASLIKGIKLSATKAGDLYNKT